MSDVVEVRRWKNELLKISIWTIKIKGEYWFFGREFTTALGYADPKDPIKDLIDSEDKKTIEELLGGNFKVILEQSLKLTQVNSPTLDFFQRLQRKQKLTNEFGLYSLCTKSRKEKAKPFQKWVYNTLKEIRETGSYTLPDGPVDNPLDLVTKIETQRKQKRVIKKHKLKKSSLLESLKAN